MEFMRANRQSGARTLVSISGSGHVRVAIVIFLLQVAVLGQAANTRIASIASALRNREFDSALQLLQPALQASPKNPQLWMFQGLAYSGKGDSKSALKSYQNALKESPDYLPALEGAAQLEYDAGSPEAVPLLQHVLRLRPDDATSHAMLAVLASKKNDCAVPGPMVPAQIFLQQLADSGSGCSHQ